MNDTSSTAPHPKPNHTPATHEHLPRGNGAALAKGMTMSKMTSFTSGPWKVSKANPHRVIVAEGDKVGLDIAEANHFVGAYRDISLANARLIAAAPDLLEALKLFVRAEKMARDGNPPQDADRLIEIGDAAIAKAEART